MMGLLGTACIAANEIKKAIPSVVFTSGKRDMREQADAMATNIVKQRSWVSATYMRSYASDMCQQWVERNPKSKTRQEISDGLFSVLQTMTYTQLGALSKHLCGLAYDIRPMGDKERDIISVIVEKHGGKFLTHEGDLVIWHCQH